MKIHNVHKRMYAVGREAAGRVLDSLSSGQDLLWPGEMWPPMRFDGPLREGAVGGHGSIRYRVSEHIPGRRVEFHFVNAGRSAGFNGSHRFEIVEHRDAVELRHFVDIDCGFTPWLRWILLLGPLHDALMEDALDKAQRNLVGTVEKPARWGIRVRFLRWMLTRRARRGRARAT